MNDPSQIDGNLLVTGWFADQTKDIDDEYEKIMDFEKSEIKQGTQGTNNELNPNSQTKSKN